MPKWAPIAGVVAVVALIGGAFALLGGGDDDSTDQAGARNEVFLEAAAEPGPDPFTPSVATPPPPSTVPVPTAPPNTAAPRTTARPGPRPTAPPSTAIRSVAGNRPGLFGVARSQPSCDGARLASQLVADPAKAAAFATIVGTTADQLAARIDTFTPLILQADTRVTNHGFDDGSAAPRQSVLEAGTAVLVDATGVPRVRCSGGTPLSEPAAVAGATFSGAPWPRFDPAAISVVSPSQPVTAFVVREVTTGQPIIRPAGTDGAADAPAPPNTRLEPPIPPATTEPTPTTSTTSTTVASASTTGIDDANIPQPNAFVTRDGEVSASSETDAASVAARAIDGDPGTSWFGDSSGSLQFTWTGRQDDLVTRVRITGGTGFTRVKVEVVDELGDPDFEQTVDIGSDIVVRPGVEGRGIRLTFTQAPGADRAGFAELEVGVTR
ncbi:MAG TPA: discoidin domain-containing protein [Acidimicrobiales bacterium]